MIFITSSFVPGSIELLSRYSSACRRAKDNVHYGYEAFQMTIEIEREEDGRWIAEVPDLPGVLVYSATRDGAISKVKALALRIIADRIENGEEVPELSNLFPAPV